MQAIASPVLPNNSGVYWHHGSAAQIRHVWQREQVQPLVQRQVACPLFDRGHTHFLGSEMEPEYQQ